MWVRITMAWKHTQRWNKEHNFFKKKKEEKRLCAPKNFGNNTPCLPPVKIRETDTSHHNIFLMVLQIRGALLYMISIDTWFTFLTRLSFYKIISLPNLLIHSGITILSTW